MKIISSALLFASAIAITSPVNADASDPEVSDQSDAVSAAEQFAIMKSWEGLWQVAETDALEIVFELTARGSVVVERWETSAGLHSMTIYHMDGDHLIATHYCPQGNQPRLQAGSNKPGEIRFAFRDVTGLDTGESHTHDLWFAASTDGTVKRSEVYLGEDGLQDPGTYTLSRKPADG